MESLRWALLVAGIAFIVVIYFLGRSRKQRHRSMVDELEENLPEFTASNLDDVDEGIGAVRVVTREADTDDALSVDTPIRAGNRDEGDVQQVQDDAGPSDIIVIYILAKPDTFLTGSQINSSAQAMGFSFGDMDIFHFHRNGRNVFSLANMLEPGSFDKAAIHDLRTTGLTIFMQLHEGDPMDDLTEMLQRSYQLAGLLDAVLCSHKRKPLTEQDAENYRNQVGQYMASGSSDTLATS